MSESAERAFIIEDPTLSGDALLDRALDLSEFWGVLETERARSGLAAGQFPIIIKPDLEAFAKGSPTATDPRLVEHLIDRLHERGFVTVNIGASADSAYFWAENRDIAVLADLLGYQYMTPSGNGYDVLDLGQDLVTADFDAGSVLHGSELARSWRDAAFRISFASNKTDERESYALGLHGLLGVLPQADKDYYYRQRVEPGDAVSALLAVTDIHFALIDAVISAHGSGGGRDPHALATGCLLAGRNLVLLDFVGALKMGLDPYVSPLAARVYRHRGLPPVYEVAGNLAPYTDWINLSPALLDSHRKRALVPAANRLVAPWLQRLDSDLFPLKRVLDARLNPRLSGFFANTDDNPSAATLLTLANYAIGAFGQWLHAYRVLYDKDALRPIEVPLGFELNTIAPDAYIAIRSELDQLEPLLADTAAATPALRWREIDGATVFCFEHELRVPFDEFVENVDVARTIQFMNDYIGGVVVPIQRDEKGRVLHQAERNLYLPQPNYLVLYQGQPIDVSKIEVCDYGNDHHRMYWKTIGSQNNSASHDDGVVSFVRDLRGTRVRILGKQRFTLPPFWQAVDLNLVPDLKRALVTHAYTTFFERTVANFEALVEGRDIRLGRAWHSPRDSLDTETLPGAALEQLVMRLAERFEGVLSTQGDWFKSGLANPAPMQIDADGFRHFVGAPQAVDSVAKAPLELALTSVSEVLGDFLRGWNEAIARDLAPGTGAAR
ncbi:MAG: DUF362 domain-containing protein [Thiotrichales bacterium]